MIGVGHVCRLWPPKREQNRNNAGLFAAALETRFWWLWTFSTLSTPVRNMCSLEQVYQCVITTILDGVSCEAFGLLSPRSRPACLSSSELLNLFAVNLRAGYWCMHLAKADMWKTVSRNFHRIRFVKLDLFFFFFVFFFFFFQAPSWYAGTS